MKRVRIAVSAPPSAWIWDLLNIGLDSISILDCVENEDGKVAQLIMARTNDPKSDMLMKALKSSSLVDDVSFMKTDGANGMVFGLVKCRKCNICGVIARKCLTRRGKFIFREGKLVWSFVAKEDEIPRLLEALASRGVHVELLESVEVKGPSSAAPSQINLVVKALEMGYFDVPRKASLQQVAKITGASPPSLSVTIRRALKRIVREYATIQGYLV